MEDRTSSLIHAISSTYKWGAKVGEGGTEPPSLQQRLKDARVTVTELLINFVLRVLHGHWFGSSD